MRQHRRHLPNRGSRPWQRRGLALVAVLWLTAVLLAIVATVGRSSRMDTKVRLWRVGQVRAKWASRAGIETAIGILNEDDRTSDSLGDLWSEDEDDFNDVVLEGCVFNVRVEDEASKLNINTVSREQLLGLPYMTEEIADAIIDWRDKDDIPSESGAEAGYYENLTYPYRIRNGPFRTIRDLLMVKGVTEELLFGEDTNFNGQLDYNERDGDESWPPDDGDDELDEGWIAYLTCYSYDNNVDASGNKRININKADERQLERELGIRPSQARWIVENRGSNGYSSIGDLISNSSPKGPPKTSPGGGGNLNQNQPQSEPLDLQTFIKIADKITVEDGQRLPGKVNINTASVTVLAALLGGDDAAYELAENIVAYRETLMYGMESIGELLQVQGMSVETFKQIAGAVTTRSNVYMIRCFSTAESGPGGSVSFVTEAVVDRSSSPCEILYWYEGAKN